MNSVLLIIKFNNNFDKIIFPLMLLIPRSTLFVGVFLHIHEFIFNKNYIKNNQNIKLTFIDEEKNINEIDWYLPVGIYFDKISNNHNYIELLCEKSDIKGLFKTPISEIKTMVQQRFKQGLATILNSTKIFVELPVKDMDDYISFAISIKYNYKDQKSFSDILDKIYNKKDYRIPFLFYHESKVKMYAINNDENETIKDTIFRSGFDTEILEKSDIIINGFNLKNIENTPILWAIKNLCYSDLLLHIIVK